MIRDAILRESPNGSKNAFMSTCRDPYLFFYAMNYDGLCGTTATFILELSAPVDGPACLPA